MVIFYSNRDISERLGIRLTKWKRWSREFLPPDPLGGLRSGYARQYSIDQAFIVFLGGHLVADMHFSIPEAKKIAADLAGWFEKQGPLVDRSGNGSQANSSHPWPKDTAVTIYRRAPKDLHQAQTDSGFFYVQRTCLADEGFEKGGPRVRRETYREEVIPSASGAVPGDAGETLEKIDGRILYASQLRNRFVNKLLGTAPA